MFKNFWRDWIDLVIKPQRELIKGHKILYGILLLVCVVLTFARCVHQAYMYRKGLEGAGIYFEKHHGFYDKEDEG